MRTRVLPDVKDDRLRRELEEPVVLRVKVEMRGVRVASRRDRRRERRVAEAVERVKIRTRAGVDADENL
jgi:hypothetical protein